MTIIEKLSGNTWPTILFGLLCSVIPLSNFSTVIAQEHEEHEEHEDHDDNEHADHEDDNDSNEESVSFSFQEIVEFGITLDTAGPGEIHFEITLPGEVSVNEDRYAHVSPRFSGLVKRVLKTTGDKVKTNDVLAIVESNESLTDFEVRSLIDGVIIEKHIVIGEITSSDTEAFIVADLSSVWVELNVFPMHLKDVHPGQRAVVTPDHGINEENGIISYLSPTVDEHSRTATARIVIDNSNGSWKPGQFVEGIVEVSARRLPLVIPRTAVFTYENESVVFVYHDGEFEPKHITLGAKDSHSVEILDGLSVGDIYASARGFTIKAELEKGSFESGHSH